MMLDPTTYQTLFAYMVHADQKIMAAAKKVEEEPYFAPQPISWGSLHEQLVHAVVAQELWFQRLEGHDVVYPKEKVEIARKDLPIRWAEINLKLTQFAAQQTMQSLLTEVRTTMRNGRRFRMPRWVAMFQISDHATYHRGHINTMIKNAGGTPSPVMVPMWALDTGIATEVME